MNVELTINWTFLTTPPTPFAMTVFWRVKGSTSAYTPVNVANGEGGTVTITTISNTTDTINTACTLEYEGYIIPDCFIGGATDCNRYLPDGITLNSACPVSDRDYWEATIDATDEQSCRGVEVNCIRSGALTAHLVDPSALETNTWLDAGYPDIIVTDENTGSGFYAYPNTYNAGTGEISGDCWVVDPGSNYTTAPTAFLVTSDQGNDLELVVTMGCNNFTYTNCRTNIKPSGNIMLGDSRTLCINAQFYVDEPFDPVADDSVFEHSLLGCCTGNGRSYTLTFNTPDALLYSTVTFAYNIANTTEQGQQYTHVLNNTTPFTTVCIVEGSIVAAYLTGGLACQADNITNAWLFDEYVTIVDNGPC